MKTGTNRRAVILLSGGMDSATAGAVARSEGYHLFALSIDYGQRHHFELSAARRVADALGVKKHVIVPVDLRKIGGSALTGEISVPQNRSDADIAVGIPITYVPARNTVFLAIGLAYAETVGAGDLFIGVNAVDYSGYPDCRREFIAAFESLANLATKAGVEGSVKYAIHTPLISLTKAEIIRRGRELGIDFAMTHTCYAPSIDGVACGVCDACTLRLKGFREAGLVDPIQYMSA